MGSQNYIVLAADSFDELEHGFEIRKGQRGVDLAAVAEQAAEGPLEREFGAAAEGDPQRCGWRWPEPDLCHDLDALARGDVRDR